LCACIEPIGSPLQEHAGVDAQIAIATRRTKAAGASITVVRTMVVTAAVARYWLFMIVSLKTHVGCVVHLRDAAGPRLLQWLNA
jgi:hypothetical protein